MFGRIRIKRDKTHTRRKHRLLKTRNERCGVDMEDLVERLSRYGMLDWYNYQDAYWGREDEYVPEICEMLKDPESIDVVISDMEQFLEEAEDWTEEDFREWGMHEVEVRSILEDLKRHRRCFR